LSAELKGGGGMRSGFAKLYKKLTNASTVEIGWNRNATYPNGMPVAAVAAINEYGGTVTIPEHEVTIRRSLNADASGEFNAEARFVKASKANFETTHTVQEHEVTIPARPFFRSMIADESPYWPNDIRLAIKECDYDAKQALGEIGMRIQQDLQTSIEEYTIPPNAPSTIARKGFNDPLVETAHMLQTANFQVK
jgi:hypothetical protein